MFYLSAVMGYLELMEYFYRKGLNINEQTVLQRCALSKACYLGYVKEVEFLLSKKGELVVLSFDNKGKTPLHNAAWGVSGGRKGKKMGGNDLFDSPEICEMLVLAGHPIDVEDREGSTPLHSAALSSGLESLKTLVKLGGDPNYRNLLGETPLFLASSFGIMDVMRYLIEEVRLDPLTENYSYEELKDKSGRQNHVQVSNLLAALIYKQLESMEYILEKCCERSRRSSEVIRFRKALPKIIFH